MALAKEDQRRTHGSQGVITTGVGERTSGDPRESEAVTEVVQRRGIGRADAAGRDDRSGGGAGVGIGREMVRGGGGG